MGYAVEVRRIRPAFAGSCGRHVYFTPTSGRRMSSRGHRATPFGVLAMRCSIDPLCVYDDGDYARAIALDRETGQANALNRGATSGNNEVRQAVDPSGKFLNVANYGSGTVAVSAIAQDGSLKDQHQSVQLPGEPGSHKVEQVSSHPHDGV